MAEAKQNENLDSRKTQRQTHMRNEGQRQFLHKRTFLK